MRRTFRLATALVALTLVQTGLAAEADPPTPDWLALDAEYRVQSTMVDPLELNGLVAQDVLYTTQRLRLDVGLEPVEGVRIITQYDLLAGALFGDNGDYGAVPEPSSGLAVTSRWPNAAGWEIGLQPDADPLDPDSYGPVLRGIEPFRINHAYGEVALPFGLLRVGRQPATQGAGLSLHDGSRINRWGVSRNAYAADRFLFATKISEVYRMAAEDVYKPDRSMDRGVFAAWAYDLVVQDEIHIGGDDLRQMTGLLQWKDPDPDWFGLEWRDFLLQVAVAGRYGDEFGTEVFGVPATLRFGVGPVDFAADFMVLVGHTREASEGMQALREPDEAKRDIQDQDLLAFGARAVVDVELGPVVATLEVDYASGDADPRDETTLSTFNFARDTNVGLLLFEHVLAFETARSAAVGIQNLAQVGARSFPITELESQGRFHNAVVLFPQVLWRPVETFHVRFGALFAWAASPVTDPVMTLLSEDGDEITDDAVNWHGGPPGNYYGTELDLQLEWRFKDKFLWTVEGAVLVPGDGLEDESGDAVPSFLLENRMTFLF